MKKLQANEIEQLLEIISKHPRLRIAHFSEGGKVFIETLNQLSIEQGYEYQLHILEEKLHQELKENLVINEISNIRRIKWVQNRYASPALQYDLLFVTASIPNDYKEAFAKKIYSHIKSAGEIILFLEKNDRKNSDEWKIFLEEYLFVAINVEVEIFENYDILIARKMHGWGGK
jgi:hypothetical protein